MREQLDVQLGRRIEGEAVTLDFDSTAVEVYGRRKPGAGVNYQGQLAYQPPICSWAQRGRLLASELLAGNDSTRGEEPRLLLRRALDHLPDGHGGVSARFDSGLYRVDLADCRTRAVRFSISVPRSSAMSRALERIDESDWRPADGLKDAEVAETTYTRVIHHARRIILRLPAGLASARDFAHAYTTARARLTTLNDEPKVQPRSLLPGFRSRPRSISSRLPPRPAANPDQATLQHPAAPDGGSTTAEHPVRRPIH